MVVLTRFLFLLYFGNHGETKERTPDETDFSSPYSDRMAGVGEGRKRRRCDGGLDIPSLGVCKIQETLALEGTKYHGIEAIYPRRLPR